MIKMDTCRHLVIELCITNAFFGTIRKWSTRFSHILRLADSARNEIDHFREGAGRTIEAVEHSVALGRGKTGFLFEIQVKEQVSLEHGKTPGTNAVAGESLDQGSGTHSAM